MSSNTRIAGNDPRTGKRISSERNVTLQQAFDKLLELKRIRESTRRSYISSMKHFEDWLDMPLVAISKDMIEQRHQELLVKPNRINASSHGRADVAMKKLRAIFSFAMDLKRRHLFRRNTQYVFPSKRAHNKPLSVGSHLTRKVSLLCGAKFTFHALRRTFATTAAKQKVPDYIIKRLINHSIKSDVTSQYLVLDVDNLRKHMNAITRTFLELFELKDKGKSVVDAQRTCQKPR